MNVSFDVSINESIYYPTVIRTFDYFLTVLEILLTIVILGGNILVCATFGKSERVRRAENFFIVQLAIADIVVGVCLPYHIFTFLQPRSMRNIYLCMLRYSSIFFSMCASILSLLALTADRYAAMTWPLTYQQTLSKTRQTLTTTVIWVTSFILGFLPPFLFNNGWSKSLIGQCDAVLVISEEFLVIGLPSFFALVSAVILSLYTKILLLAYRHTRAIQAMQFNKDNNQKQEFKAAKTTAVVLGIFYLCWAPSIFCVCLQLSLNKVHSPLWNVIRGVLTLFSIFNSALNPIVYAYRMPAIRQEAKKLFGIRE